MIFLIGLLTVLLVIDSALLIFLVLIQLPKKDAGAGLAFGGSATDALFGAGSGTVLTKITKYAAGIFFVLAVMLSIMRSRHHGGSSDFNKNIASQSSPPAASAPMGARSTVPAAPNATAPAISASNLVHNLEETATNRAAATNAPASTNTPAPK